MPSRTRLRAALGGLLLLPFLLGFPAIAKGGEPVAAATRVPIAIASVQPRPGLDFWVAETTDCPQVMGSEPWPCLEFHHLGPDGIRRDGDWLAFLAGAAAGRPVVVILHGNRYNSRDAVDEAFSVADSLDRFGALPPGAMVVSFHWPSQRVFRREVRDLNEKSRRAMIAGYHLARWLSAFPAGSRICLIGHSHGGKAITVALHLLGGGQVSSMSGDPDVGLPWPPPPLHLRAVLIACASDHDWLDPGERLDEALPVCEALLNLYNRADYALWLYPLGRGSDGGKALGRVGLKRRDLRRLGPLACRVEQHNIRSILRRSHDFAEAFTDPQVAAWVAPYVWACGN